MYREVGVGVIGLGWMERLYARAHRRLSDRYTNCAAGVRLVALAETEEEFVVGATLYSCDSGVREMVASP